MFVIKRSEDGKYVNQPGSKNSYTSILENAQKFSTRESAQSNACGNESVVSVDSILR